MAGSGCEGCRATGEPRRMMRPAAPQPKGSGTEVGIPTRVAPAGDSFGGPLGSGGEMAVPGWRTARARYSDWPNSDWPNRLGLRALGPLDDVELDPLVLPQFAEAARVDGRVMHEDVRAAS